MLVILALVMVIGLLHAFYFMQLFPYGGWTVEKGGPVIIASTLSGTLGPLVGILLAWSHRTQRATGRRLCGALLLVFLLGQIALFATLLSEEQAQTSDWGRGDRRAINAPVKFNLGTGIVGSLIGLFFCFGRSKRPGATARAAALLLCSACFGIAPQSAHAQSTCDDLKDLVLTRGLALSDTVPKVSNQVLSTSGGGAATKKLCGDVRSLEQEVGDLKRLVAQKKSLCANESSPDTSLTDITLKAVHDMTKDVCK